LAEQSATTTPRRFRVDGHVVVALTDVTLGDERGQDAEVFILRDGKTVWAYMRAVSALMDGVFGWWLVLVDDSARDGAKNE
jgi:uncharacterized protein